jgi:hypothetical protein|tara:strand:- start:116 stop:292 length:177 start_codon:yes stop_codon:yes gene_type:complete
MDIKNKLIKILDKELGSDHGFKASEILVTKFKDGSTQVESNGDWVIIKNNKIISTPAF